MREKAFHFGKKVLKHELIKGSFYLFIGTILSAFFAFLINLFFARNLSKPDYGVYASLIALITLFTIPAQSLTPIIIRFAGEYHTKGEEEKLKKFYLKMNKLLFIVAIAILAAFLIFSSLIENFLKLDNFLYIPMSGLIIAISYIAIVNTGFLQGQLKFLYISITQISGSIIRIIAGIILIFMGYRVFGAIWASILSFFIVYLLGFFPLKFLFKKTKDIDVKVPTNELAKYAVPSTIAILSLSSFISIDVVMVKHFFTPFEAGLYGGLSLIGKVIFYFTGPIPNVMFPLLIKRITKNEPYNKLFFMSMLLVLIPSVLISAFYFLFPAFAVKFFLGTGYLGVSRYIGLFGIYIAVFSLLNLCVNFFLSLRKTLIFIPLLIGSLLQIILISFFHTNFLEVILISLTICSLLLIGFLIYYITKSKKLLAPKIDGNF